jgi:two-component system LytT family response regulator
MFRAVVVDDESLTMEHVCSLLEEIKGVSVAEGYTNPSEAMRKIFENPPDVVFLDIEMPEISGLKLAEMIYQSNFDCEIIFLTAYDEYALEAFRVNALDYILKPITLKTLEGAIQRLEKRKVNIIPFKEPQLTVKAFGGFNVWVKVNKEEELLKWYTIKSKELFAYLVLQEVTSEISKWRLADLLFPEKDPKKGDINLRSTTCRLNKTLRESGTNIRVVSSMSNYSLKVEDISVDAHEIKKLILKYKTVDMNNLKSYKTIFSAYNGSLLEGYDFTWCEDLRIAYQRYFSVLCKRLSDFYIWEMKDSNSALDIVEGWLKHDPYNEEAHCIALELYFTTGGKGAAEMYFTKLSSVLLTDLGLEPSEAVFSLYHRIMGKT